MSALLGFLVLASMVAAPVGLLMCVSPAKRNLGKTIALSAVASFVVMMGIVVARGPVATSSTQAVAAATSLNVEPKPEDLSRSDILANFKIRSFSWKKESFGTIMMATFLLRNYNPMPMKDIEVTCSSSGPSGSIIDTNSRTIFDVVQQKSYLQVDNLNMGFIRSEAVDTTCRVTGFKKI